MEIKIVNESSNFISNFLKNFNFMGYKSKFEYGSSYISGMRIL